MTPKVPCDVHPDFCASYCATCFDNETAWAKQYADEAEALRNERDTLKGFWETACGQMAEMCVMLGVDPDKQPADAWTLHARLATLIRSARDAVQASDAYDHADTAPMSMGEINALDSRRDLAINTLRAALGDAQRSTHDRPKEGA